MAAQLANAENKCATLAAELEASWKLIDTLRQDKDKVIDMSIERVNKLLPRAEAAEKRIAELESLMVPQLAQPAVTHDAATAIRACLDEFPEGVRDVVEECAAIAEKACYTAPLVPVVPAALPDNDDEDGRDIDYLEPPEVYALGRTAGWNACRAAMLQCADDPLTHDGKNHPEDKLGMVDHFGGSNNMVEPVTDNTNQQFESLSRGDK